MNQIGGAEEQNQRKNARYGGENNANHLKYALFKTNRSENFKLKENNLNFNKKRFLGERPIQINLCNILYLPIYF